MRRRLKNNRPKALFGIAEAAATLAAAGIQAAATTAGAATQAAAANKAAKAQARATSEAADINAEAIKESNEVQKELTTRSIEANRETNKENQQIQKDIQLTLQMMAGQENAEEAKKEAKIVAKNGRSVNARTLLRGVYQNTPFEITDGGAAIPLGQTPEGFGVYELVGDNHEQYHKSRGKYKTGVGIKFPNGNVIEGEGNGKSNKGELLITTPDDALFVSKHTLKGFNPADAVKAGMHPLEAFAIQENIKDMYNIPDDGEKKKCGGRRRLKLAGGNLVTQEALGTGITPMSTDVSGAGAVGGVLATQLSDTTTPVEEINNTSAKNGKRIRLRAAKGCRVKAAWGDRIKEDKHGFWGNGGANLIGGGINAAANLLGGGLTAWANARAGRTVARANRQAAAKMADAYARLQGIDPSIISSEDFKATHFLPVVRSARVNINPQITKIDREAREEADAIDNTTASSAARLARRARLNSVAAQQRSEVYGNQTNAEEQIAQSNAQRISEAAAKNAELDMQAKRDLTDAKLELAKYNANVKNQSILGVAESQAAGITGSAQSLATGRTSAAQAFGAGISGAGQAIGAGVEAASNYRLMRDWINRSDGGRSGLGGTPGINEESNKTATPTNTAQPTVTPQERDNIESVVGSSGGFVNGNVITVPTDVYTSNLDYYNSLRNKGYIIKRA